VSKDVYDVDNQLAQDFQFFLFSSLFVIGSLGSIIAVVPMFAVSLPFFLIAYVFILNYYKITLRGLKRLDSVSRSPIITIFSEALTGVSTIRGFGSEELTTEKFYSKMDTSISAWSLLKAAERWLAMRLEILGMLIALISSILLIENRNTISPGLTGFALTFALSISSLLGQTIRSSAQFEAGLNSVERILYYSQMIDQEKPKRTPTVHPDPDWLKKSGSIELKNVSVRYRENLPEILHNLSLKINHGEKIAVIGRSGSGKSTMFLALMRIIDSYSNEPQTLDSEIIMDGQNIDFMEVSDIRSRIGIVQQMPIIFEATIKENIDPFDQHTDEEILEALKKLDLYEAIVGKMRTSDDAPGSFLTNSRELTPREITQFYLDDNLSAGEKQKLVMSKALLKNSKILLLDENISNLDMQTAETVTRVVEKEFSDSTIISIAHNLFNTTSADRILVLGGGNILEFDSPLNLINNPQSEYYSMVQELGDNAVAKIKGKILS